MLKERGFSLYATPGSAQFLRDNNIEVTTLFWPDDETQPNTLEYLKTRRIDLVINIPKNLSKSELNNDYLIRRFAVDFNIPLITNARLASAFIYAICKLKPEDIEIKGWDEY
jgi:carbamoyl-phosphate synthase large subunit